MNPSQIEQKPKHWVIIPAAGVGARMQSALPKQYLQILGATILQHTAALFSQDDRFQGIFIGLSPEDPYIDNLNLIDDCKVNRFDGGAERVHTVLNGLDALQGKANEIDWVWVHDAARPCLSKQDIDQLFNVLSGQSQSDNSDGALLVAPLIDTIKYSEDGVKIDKTLDRNRLWRAFTPQVFQFHQLMHALSACLEEDNLVTDEASAIETVGGKPLLVEGLESNIKITRPRDLEIAKANLLNQKSEGPKEGVDDGLKKEDPDEGDGELNIDKASGLWPRIGTGFDVHAFCEGDHLVLGGVKIPYSQSFAAHSDGDVLIHAIMDALLGALSLGDIGKHFPDTDERYKGANSRDLLRAVVTLIGEKGYCVGNIDSVIMAQAPKMAPHIEKMQANIALDLGIDLECVSVKATTTEKLGFTGRKEGVACQASVLLFPLSPGER